MHALFVSNNTCFSFNVSFFRLQYPVGYMLVYKAKAFVQKSDLRVVCDSNKDKICWNYISGLFDLQD